MLYVIDKFKQKNNGSFFLMDAKDIQFDATDASKGSLLDALQASGSLSGKAGTKWYLTTETLVDGATIPDDIKDTANVGDVVMNTETGDMFTITGDAESKKISKVGSLKGIKGDQGDKGETGEQGEKGDKGDKGDPFSVAKIYNSVAEMNAGYATDGIAEGSFVLINTNDVDDPDNSKLFVKGETAYTFLTDLSGATGIAGPQGDQGEKGETGEQGEKGEKGDKGDPFSIAKIFKSVAEMNAGFATDGIAEGSFVLINTDDVDDPDNSKLYVKGAESYTFITDLSGATGIAGPQGEQGIQGETGATGTSMRLKGEWAASTAYVNNDTEVDVVTYNGSTFACAESHTSGDAFDASKWTLIAQRGTDGVQGEKGDAGEQGEKGADGTTPHIGENGNWFIGDEDTGKPSRGEGVSETINQDVETLKKQMEDLMYKKIDITSFSVSPSVVEMGTTVTDVTLTWAVNKTPTTLTLDAETLDVSATSKKLTEQTITSNTTYKITAKDERDAEASKSTSIQFLNGVYSGVSTVADADGIVDSVIQGLTKKLATKFTGDYTVNAGEGQYIYFAYPASMTAEPQFYVGGFAGGFGLVKTFDFTNASGHKESYKVYRSANANLGETIVTVK